MPYHHREQIRATVYSRSRDASFREVDDEIRPRRESIELRRSARNERKFGR